LVLESYLEDAAKSGELGLTRLYKRRSGRRLSKTELTDALRRGEELGQIGEELVNARMERLVASNEVAKFRWESQDNAAAPYDFWYEKNGKPAFLDVKATSGQFERTIHVSLPELLAMHDCGAPYYIYRLYEVEERTAKMRISEETKSIAESILNALAALPAGVTSDGVSISPKLIRWGAEEVLTMPDPI